jgi:hypothetical protein
MNLDKAVTECKARLDGFLASIGSDTETRFRREKGRIDDLRRRA